MVLEVGFFRGEAGKGGISSRMEHPKVESETMQSLFNKKC